MVKGFIFFRDGKMPFVIENYRMELFTDDSLLDDFCKEYNFKENYILHGQCFDIGIRGRKATFLVENSMGSTCYLRCYIINMFDKDEEYDSIGLQSPSLDEVFRYEYEYIDMVRAGINLAIEPKVVYKVPFGMNNHRYELEFRIGHNNRLGLLEDLDRRGELLLPLHTNEIQECYDITNVLHRLAMFMTSHAEVPFKRITLYKQGLKAGWFYCPLISEDIVGGHGGFFHEFDVMKYIPKILNNIALDSGNKITQSIPLGHLGDFNSMYTPQRFVEQVIVDKDDERFCHIFIKGCADEDYTGFFQTAGYIEQNTTPVCDSEQYCIDNIFFTYVFIRHFFPPLSRLYQSESELIHFFESRFLDESEVIHSWECTNLYVCRVRFPSFWGRRVLLA